MPLQSGQLAPTTTTATPVVDSVKPVWSQDVGTMRATWTDPSGQVWELSNTADDLGYFTVPGIAGWGARPYEYVVDAVPRGGDMLRAIRGQSAKLTWPLHIWGDTHQQFVQRYRGIKAAFLRTAWRGQPGVLRVERPDGTAREVECFYEDGFGGGGAGVDAATEDWLSANPVLTLVAMDGFWRATQPVVVTRSYAPGGSFLQPFLQVSLSQVLGDTVVVNPGDVAAWPTWVITGPMTGITATNVTTGLVFQLSYTLLAGQQITITTDRPTVRGPAGQVLTGALNWPSQAYLWPLQDGPNEVTLNISGASAGTGVQLTFHPRFEGA